jgi:hypothetical protein
MKRVALLLVSLVAACAVALFAGRGVGPAPASADGWVVCEGGQWDTCIAILYGYEPFGGGGGAGRYYAL